jgi:hypothetical protein
MPVEVIWQPFCCNSDKPIKSSLWRPCNLSTAEIDAVNALPYTIDSGDGCYMIPAYLCGIRYRSTAQEAVSSILRSGRDSSMVLLAAVVSWSRARAASVTK